jgi:hypothetical protein
MAMPLPFEPDSDYRVLIDTRMTHTMARRHVGNYEPRVCAIDARFSN